MNTTAVVTLSADREITIPTDMAGQLDLRTGTKIIVDLVDGQLVLTPQPQNLTAALIGSAQKRYGRSARDVNEYLQMERASWEPDTL